MAVHSSDSQQKEENNTTNNNEVVDSSSLSSSSSSEEDLSEAEKGVESKSGSDPLPSSVQEKQKSEEESDNGEESEEDDESRRRSNHEIRMKKKNDVMVLVAASTEDEKVSESEEEEPNAVTVSSPNTDEIAKARSSSKRPLEEEKEDDISSADQRRKKMKEDVTEDLPRSKFEQKFTDEDELVIMKRYVDFNYKHKRLPQHREFTDLIKSSISFPVSHRQMSEKIRRVKNKYKNAIKGGKKKNTPHDLEVFELCQKIWGNQNQLTNNKERGIIKQEEEVEVNSKFMTFVNDYLRKIMAIGGGGGISHVDLGVFDKGKRAYFAKKLKALMVKELELYSEKAELVTSVVEELNGLEGKEDIAKPSCEGPSNFNSQDRNITYIDELEDWSPSWKGDEGNNGLRHCGKVKKKKRKEIVTECKLVEDDARNAAHQAIRDKNFGTITTDSCPRYKFSKCEKFCRKPIYSDP
ncbi:hypothetical protein LguiB_020346 [Lonicera macranthoides]